MLRLLPIIMAVFLTGCVTPPPDDPFSGTPGDDANTADNNSSSDAGPTTDGDGENRDGSTDADTGNNPPPDAGGVVTVEFQDGVSPSSAYAGTRDTEIDGSSPESAAGANPDIQADENLAILIKWNTTQIPQTATVLDAYIELTSGEDGSSDDYDVYFVNRPWSEAEATWNSAADGRSWEEPGCRGVDDRSTVSIGTIGNEMSLQKMVVGPSLQIRDRVREWIANPSRNHGITIQLDSVDTDGLHISTREALDPAIRPKLVVTYER